MPHKISLLDVISDVTVFYYRKIDVNLNFAGQFYVSQVILSIENGSNDFLHTRCINFFLDTFSNGVAHELKAYYWKIDGNSNLVAQVILNLCKSYSCYD